MSGFLWEQNHLWLGKYFSNYFKNTIYLFIFTPGQFLNQTDLIWLDTCTNWDVTGSTLNKKHLLPCFIDQWTVILVFLIPSQICMTINTVINPVFYSTKIPNSSTLLINLQTMYLSKNDNQWNIILIRDIFTFFCLFCYSFLWFFGILSIMIILYDVNGFWGYVNDGFVYWT